MQVPCAGDDLMELSGGRGCIVVSGIECRLEHRLMSHERGELRIGMIAGVF